MVDFDCFWRFLSVFCRKLGGFGGFERFLSKMPADFIDCQEQSSDLNYDEKPIK